MRQSTDRPPKLPSVAVLVEYHSLLAYDKRRSRNLLFGVLRQPPRHGATQILSIIVVTLQQPHVLVPADLLLAPQVAAGQIERPRDLRVPQAMRPHPKA